MDTKYMKTDFEDFAEFLKKIGDGIQSKSIDKNGHLKALMAENKKDFIKMLDTSYQDAFNIKSNHGRKGK